MKFFKGLVTDFRGLERGDEAYVTYGTTSDPDDEQGEITIKGEDAPKIAERICQLLNAQ